MRIQRNVRIERPPEAVWPWLTEPERLQRWMKGLLGIERVSEGEIRPGFRSRLKIKEGKRVSEYEEEILAYEPPHRLEVRIWGGCLPQGMEMRYLYEVAAEDGGSRITCTGEAEVRGFFMRLISPLMKLFSGMQLGSFFRALKAEIEAEPAASPEAARYS